MTSLAAVLDNSNEALSQRHHLLADDSSPPRRVSDDEVESTVIVPPESPSPTSPTTPASPASPKQKSDAKPRDPHSSPSPPPPPPPLPPLQTIRLEIKLGGPDKYEVDVAAMAKQTGQRPSTPVTAANSSSKQEEEESSAGESDAGATEEGKKKKRKRKKNVASEYYDITDPFIDDSELAIDERTWFAQTKQQGFYVSSGEVALLKDKTKKPKSKKPGAPASTVTTAGAPSSSRGKQDLGVGTSGGARDQPLSVSNDDEGGLDDARGGSVGMGGIKGEEDEEVGQKRKRYITVVDQAGKKRKIVDINSFPQEIQTAIEVLKDAIAKEDWSTKGKFPPTIKPMLADLAILAIKLGEYEDHFFTLMPTLFPYNKYTMMKLIKRTVFQDHVKYLVEKQEALLSELAEQAKAGFAKAEEEWEKSVQAWDKRQEKARLEAAAASGGDTAEIGESANPSATPTRHPTEEMDVDGETMKDKDKDGAPTSTAPATVGKDAHPPSKKYRLTESMKAIVWQLVMLSNECCRLENEKNTLEGSVIQVSEQGTRKLLYQKIVAAFPEGWMSSGQISRDVSSMKKRFEKEPMENE